MREPELKLAKQLIDQIASETFDPTQYHDEVRERIQADIEKQGAGAGHRGVAAPSREPARIIDLMEALKASLGKGAGAAAPQGRARPRGRRAKRTKLKHTIRDAALAAPRRPRRAEPKRAKKR